MVKSFLKTKFPKLFYLLKQEAKPAIPVNPVFQTEVLHPIVLAFESGGKKYYQFEDIMNLCHARAFRAMEIYEEVQSRCTRELILLHTDAINNLLLANPINVFEIKKLNEALKERADFIISGDTLWKLASVVYFDETENPYDYDYKYGIKKIQEWQKEKDVSAFFFNTPISKLIPSLTLSESDLRTYIKVAEAVTKKQLDDIYQYTSKNKRNQDLFKISELLNTASH